MCIGKPSHWLLSDYCFQSVIGWEQSFILGGETHSSVTWGVPRGSVMFWFLWWLLSFELSEAHGGMSEEEVRGENHSDQ